MNADALFTCALCGNTYEKAWTDEECFAEKKELYPGIDIEDCVIVCEDCYMEYKNVTH